MYQHFNVVCNPHRSTDRTVSLQQALVCELIVAAATLEVPGPSPDLFWPLLLLQIPLTTNRDTGFSNYSVAQDYIKNSRSTKGHKNVSILPDLFPFILLKECMLLNMALLKQGPYLASSLPHAYSKARVMTGSR